MKLFESSIWIVYEAAPATSLQSKRIVWPGAKRASAAGLTREGAASVVPPPPPPAGFTVSEAVLVTLL